VSGMEHRIIYQKKPFVTIEEMIQAFQSKRAEERAVVLRYELDYELSVLYEALSNNDEETIASSKEKLVGLRSEMLQLEL
jgi:hypothetical protein